MKDRSKCDGHDQYGQKCKKKQECYRFVNPKAEYQWWTMPENVDECDLYIPLTEKYKK